MNKNTKIGLGIGGSCLGLFILFIIITYLAGCTKIEKVEDNNPTPSTQTSQDQSTQTTTPTQEQPAIPFYEIVNKDDNNPILKTDLYIKPETSDNELKQIVKEFQDNYSKYTFITLNFFDDKNIADDYFKKYAFSDEGAPDAIFKHYIAVYRKNANTGFNQLSRNKDLQWVIIQKY